MRAIFRAMPRRNKRTAKRRRVAAARKAGKASGRARKRKR